MKMMGHRTVWSISMLLAIIVVCVGFEVRAGDEGNCQGSGSWSSSDGSQSGTWAADLFVAGNDVNGSIVIEGDPAITGGEVAGTLSGATINFGILSESQLPNSNSVAAVFDGTVSPTGVLGTFSSASNISGFWQGQLSGGSSQ